MGNKTKIIYIILNGTPYGGSEKHVTDLMNLIDKDKFEKILIYSKGNNLIEKIEKNNRENCIPIDRGILSIVKVIKLLKENKPDIIHVHAARGIFIGRIATLLYKAIYKSKVKLIATSHGLWLPNKKNNCVYKFLMHFLKDKDDKTIAVSYTSKDELIRCGYDTKKLKTIYNGVDFEKYNKYRKLKFKVENISFIGRFTDQKGIKILLEAIKNDKNEFKFNIYGEGELENYIDEYINKNNLTNVKLHGYSNNVVEVFEQSDIVVAPSIDEGLPYVLIEAVNCGLPIISTEVGGIPEIVYNLENGLLIESNSSSKLNEALDKIRKLDVRKLSKKSIEISKKFSIETMIEEIEQVYDEVLKG